MVLHQRVLVNNGLRLFYRIGLKQQHATSPLCPVASFCLVSLGNQVLNIGFVSGYVLVKGGFIDDAFFNFDKPGHFRF